MVLAAVDDNQANSYTVNIVVRGWDQNLYYYYLQGDQGPPHSVGGPVPPLG